MDKPASSGEAVPEPTCSICGTPRSDFKKVDGLGRPFQTARQRARLCSGCSSGERQRVFADLLSGTFGRRAQLAGAHIFAISPTRSERRVLDAAGIGRLTVADIRPEVKPDLIADVSAMPHVPSDSYDVVLASYVLTCVYDLEGALAEFARVLKPGGVLLTTDPELVGKPTETYTDLARVTAWYGEEAYEKYRVGAFRRFGELDVMDTLGEYFLVETFVGIDAPTEERIVWHASRRLAEAESA